MLRVRDTVRIHQPREVVFAFITDPANWPTWDPSMLRADLEGATVEKGARVSGVSKVTGRKRAWTVEVTEHDAPSRFAVRSVTDGFPFEMSWSLTEPKPGTTDLTSRESTTGLPGLLGKLPEPMLLRRFEHDVERASHRLKQHLERA